MKQFSEWYDRLCNASADSLNKSIANCHADGLFSLVFDGVENGQLTRAFIATKKILPTEIALHTHRYGLRLGVVAGVVTHHLAYEAGVYDDGVWMDQYDYKSPLNGGDGLKHTGRGNFELQSYPIPRGGLVNMDETQLHSVSCAKGSIWIVEEEGFRADTSVVVGAPFETDGMYTEPRQYQVNDMHKRVKDALFEMISVHRKYSGGVVC